VEYITLATLQLIMCELRPCGHLRLCVLHDDVDWMADWLTCDSSAKRWVNA